MTTPKQTIIIKIGSSVITNQQRLDLARIYHLADQVSQLTTSDYRVALVVSGAVANGLRHTPTPDNRQLAASIGQAYLLTQLYQAFYQHHLQCTQILLTKRDLFSSAKHTLKQVLQDALDHGIIPIINENDTLQLNSFKGNDHLATHIAKLIKANQLLLLSDVDGVFDSQKNVIPHLNQHTMASIGYVSKDPSVPSVGGIHVKIKAAQTAARAGIISIIANGKQDQILTRLLLNREILGTQVFSK